MRIGRIGLALAAAFGMATGSSLEAQLISQWELDGNLLDSEGPRDGVFHGGPEPLFVPGHDGTAGGAIYLDGTDDVIEVADDPLAPTLALSDAFTLALWFRAASTAQSEKYLLARNGGGGQYAIIYEYVDDRVELYAPSRLSGDDPRPVSAMPLADTKWHHLAYTYDGATLAGYVDGVEAFAAPIVFSLDDVFFASWWIGAAHRAANHVHGAIDDVRIYGEALDSGDIADLYTEPVEVECPASGDTHCGGIQVSGPPDGGPGTYTVSATATDDSGDAVLYTFRADDGLGRILTVGPQKSPTAELGLAEGTWTVSVSVDDDPSCPDVAADAECAGETVEVVPVPKLLARWELDGDLADSAGSNDGIFFGGDVPTWVEGQDGTPEGAILLDGLDDYVQVPPATELAVSDAFTLALWFRAETNDQLEKYLLSRNDAIPGGTGKQYAIIWEYADDQVDFYAPSRLFGDDPRAGGASLMPLADTEWHHIAYAYDGATWSGYIDGEQVFSRPLVFALDDTFASSWWIGAANPLGNHANGAFDDVRIYSYGLSAGEILELAGGVNPCPAQGDTHATGLTVDGPLDGEPGTPGTYEVQAAGTDDSGDAVLFTFTARPEVGAPVVVGPQEAATARVELSAGTWTVSVTVDDDPLCSDAADDATRSTVVSVAIVPELVGWWPLDGDLADAARGNDGIFSGDLAPAFVDGFDGSAEGALGTDGIDDHVEIPYSPALELGSAFTLALWFRPASTDQAEKYLLSRHSATNQYAIIYEYLQDSVELFGGGAFTGADPRPGSAMAIPDAEWHHIAYAYDGTTLSGYIDGVRLVANDIRFSFTAFESSWWIGSASATENHVAGAFDDVRIYSYGLTEAEVLELVGGEPPGRSFVRGDANADDAVNITDGIFVLNYLFLGGPTPPCEDAADANDDAAVNITDGIYVLNFLFLGGADPLAPGPSDCGPDPSDEDGVTCRAFPPCEG